MYTLIDLISAFFNSIRAFIGLVLPIFSDAADFKNWPVWVRVFISIVLLIGICVGLYFLGPFIYGYLANAPKILKEYYLPLLFLLIVAISWLAYALWKLLTADDDAIEFPDIKGEWSDAMARLNSSGLNVRSAPLFLVLGRPSAGLDSLFLAAEIKDIIRTPKVGRGATDDPSLRVYAWDEAIFVVCPGASAWGLYCFELDNPLGGAEVLSGEEEGNNAGKTIDFGSFGNSSARSEMADLMSAAKFRDLTPDEQSRLRYLADTLDAPKGPAKKKTVSIPDDQRSRATRRLRYLCKLIRRERKPECPINGVLTLIPWAATESKELITIGSGMLEQELIAIRQVFQLRYQTLGLVCDLETARGFKEFRSGFPKEMLKKRIGQRLPLVPAVDNREEMAELLGRLAQWIGLSILPRFILEFLRLEAQNDPRRTPSQGETGNRNLYLLMREVYERGPRLADLLSRGVPSVGGRDEYSLVPLFGGCYLAGTGNINSEQAAFVPGVFQRVLEGQNAVCWSPQALEYDARMKRFTIAGYLLLTVFVAFVVAVVYLLSNR